MKMPQLTSTITASLLPLALCGPLTLGCLDAIDSAVDGTGDDLSPPAEVSSAALQIEQAERLLDRGDDLEQARALLVHTLGIADITPEERSAALLALSRAHEALGNSEAAIKVIEDEIAAMADQRDWSGRDFTKRLRQLLTGSESTPGLKVPSTETVAPFASVLLGYFPADADGAVQAKLFLAGGESSVSSELGTFNLHGALRAKQDKGCPFCDLDVRVSQSVRRSDWLLIPRSQKHFADALTVFYFDLGEGRIPERYEAHLPMKVAQIVTELEAGKSFVVAKERPGSPPTILLAAPRSVMLPDVEDYLAQLDALPTEPLYVDVSLKLRPEEIRAVVRAQWYPHMRQCFDQLLAEDPVATGRLKARFKIDRSGKIVSSDLETKDAPLRNQSFLTCVGGQLDELEFPKTDGPTTVSYPFHLTPN